MLKLNCPCGNRRNRNFTLVEDVAREFDYEEPNHIHAVWKCNLCNKTLEIYKDN